MSSFPTQVRGVVDQWSRRTTVGTAIAASATPICSVASGGAARTVESVIINNPTGGSLTVTLSLDPSGSAAGAVILQESVSAGAYKRYPATGDVFVHLAEGDVLNALGSSTGLVATVNYKQAV